MIPDVIPEVSSQDPATSWRRLDPRMLVVRPVVELVRAVPALLGLLVAGSSSGRGPVWSLLGIGVVVVLGTLRWFTTTYQVSPSQVLLRHGLLRRQVLTVPRERVRTVDVTAHPMHRIMGLTRVTIGTGRSDRSREEGLTLDALSAAEAARLRTELLARREPARTPAAATVAGGAVAAPAVPPPEVELARLHPGWLRYGPFTLSGILTVGLLAGVIANAVNEAHLDPSRFGPLRALARAAERTPTAAVVATAVVALVVVVALASTLGYLLAFWRFRLTRQPGSTQPGSTQPGSTLHVTRGLVTTRATTIEERRLRGVELSEPLLLRAVGGARCIAVATGLRVGRGAERGGSLLLPPAPRAAAVRVGGAVLRDPDPLVAPLVGHGPRARRRRFTRALTPAALLLVLLAALWWWGGLPAWPWQAALAALPLVMALAADRAHSLGHALLGRWLVIGWGSLVRRRVVLERDGIVGATLRRSLVQRWAGLATLVATTAAGRQRYRVVDVELAEAVRLADAVLPGLLIPFLAPAAAAKAVVSPTG